ncbi:MAG: exodeoxyribonuclease VII large subunit [Oscillospiraceae bacterium]|nr:exodeoxyribonuclease VII large subunit [Oscillospiraceae bacterium]
MSSILTVSQINRYISFKLKEDKKLHGILVSGEISNFTNHTRTGHLYFTLKDNETSIKAVMFSSMASRLNFAPKNGMKVIVSANVQVYERDGVYQLYVNDMQPDGIGALYLAYEQLKEKLLYEGLFDEAHKKPLPEFPNKIGIITSLEAAALQDMLNIISRRYPLAQITIFPALVQGINAPESLCKAIEKADTSELDLLICGRGGGSFEDLMAFNNEQLARTIYSCNTPIISAVGHETDTTIADFAADLRAPTPSAAAELAVPDMTVIYNKLDLLAKMLAQGFIMQLDTKYRKLETLEKRIEDAVPFAQINLYKEKLSNIEKSLDSAYKNKLLNYSKILAEKSVQLDALSPLKTLARGYSLVYKEEQLVKSTEAVSAGDKVDIQLSDGIVSATIN